MVTSWAGSPEPVLVGASPSYSGLLREVRELNRAEPGLKRRRNKKLEKWLAAVDEAKWINCRVGITAREKTDPPRTRAQEVPSGIAGMRVIVEDYIEVALTKSVLLLANLFVCGLAGALAVFSILKVALGGA